MTAAREKSRMLRGSFGEEPWKVALEPGCPGMKCQVSAHALSPLKDRILKGITE